MREFGFRDEEIGQAGAVFAAFANGDMREPVKVFASEFNAYRMANSWIANNRFTKVEILPVYND